MAVVAGDFIRLFGSLLLLERQVCGEDAEQQLAAIADIELHVQPPQVAVDRMSGKLQLLRNLLLALVVQQPLDNLEFAWRKCERVA